jgi:hypothetical protein
MQNDHPRDDSRDGEKGTGSPGVSVPTKSSSGSNPPLAYPDATLIDVPHRDFPNPNFSDLNLDTAATFVDPDATMVDAGPTARASGPVAVRVQPSGPAALRPQASAPVLRTPGGEYRMITKKYIGIPECESPIKT